MIKALKIRNVQSHKKTNLRFSKGVNVILGSTDSGKSAIFRSIRFCAKNEPKGNLICSNWGGRTKVVLIPDETTVTRIKEKNTNTYLVHQKNAEKLKLTAFGAKVPSEVETALNLSEINLQQQMDGPFLLNKTPGAVAAHFNKIANLEVIDLATQRIKREIKQLGASIAFKEADKKKKEKVISEFDFIEKFDIDLEVLEVLESDVTNLQKNIKKLNKVITDCKDSDVVLEKASILSQFEDMVRSLLLLSEKREDLYATIEEIHNKHQLLIEYRNNLEHEEKVDRLLIRFDKKDNIKESYKELNTSILQVKANQASIKLLKIDLKKLESNLLRNMPKICPLCNTNLKI